MCCSYVLVKHKCSYLIIIYLEHISDILKSDYVWLERCKKKLIVFWLLLVKMVKTQNFAFPLSNLQWKENTSTHICWHFEIVMFKCSLFSFDKNTYIKLPFFSRFLWIIHKLNFHWKIWIFFFTEESAVNLWTRRRVLKQGAGIPTIWKRSSRLFMTW